jgi:transglutaminase-like putative cysteine protease
MLAPSVMISSEDPAIVAMATAAVAGEPDGARRAVLLEKYVHGLIRQANYRNVFATASEAAKSREGDCSEFAVLLAAMLRANKIPARVAVGLVYLERSQAFGFHMWTEAYLSDRWVPLDATLAGGGIGADHIKIGDTALTAGASDPVLLRVTDVLGAKPSITLQSVTIR